MGVGARDCPALGTGTTLGDRDGRDRDWRLGLGTLSSCFFFEVPPVDFLAVFPVLLAITKFSQQGSRQGARQASKGGSRASEQGRKRGKQVREEAGQARKEGSGEARQARD